MTLRLLFLLLLVFPIAAKAQDPALGVWAGAGVEKRFGKAFSVEVNGQIRIGDNFTITRAYLGELGLGYKLTKNLKVGAFYRYTGRRRYDKTEGEYYYRPYHRFYGEVSYGGKLWKKLKGDYRLRYQNQFKDDVEGIVADRSYVRNKFELSYDLTKRLSPFVSADVFYRIGTGVDQVRSKVGVDLSLSKRQSLTLAVFTDVPVNDGPITDIFGNVGYKLKFK
ncbi:MAG: DUF2490 domain-containing protein [Cytophagales bacterium]|nr:MAG: DUF2490 domain-containing protein [Cytophagales bacterium]